MFLPGVVLSELYAGPVSKADRADLEKLRAALGPHLVIRLNTDLAKKPRECLEYIVVHETVHLIEPTHNARFLALMDLFMPQWPIYRDQLNQLLVRHEEWTY